MDWCRRLLRSWHHAQYRMEVTMTNEQLTNIVGQMLYLLNAIELNKSAGGSVTFANEFATLRDELRKTSVSDGKLELVEVLQLLAAGVYTRAQVRALYPLERTDR